MSGDDLEQRLTRAEEALDGGRAEAALEELAGLDGPADVPLLRAEAWLTLGALERAEEELQAAEAELEPTDPDRLWLRSELALVRWQPEASAEHLAAHLDQGATSSAQLRLALALDALGRFDEADRAEAAARELDPELAPLLRLTEADFDAAVEAALESLRQRHPAEVARVRVVTEPMPWRGLALPAEPQGVPPDLLGLFVGPSLQELAEDASAELPPTIYLFQRNLERLALPEAELRQEIQTTLYHEFGHLLGWDEDGVAALGLA